MCALCTNSEYGSPYLAVLHVTVTLVQPVDVFSSSARVGDLRNKSPPNLLVPIVSFYSHSQKRRAGVCKPVHLGTLSYRVLLQPQLNTHFKVSDFLETSRKIGIGWSYTLQDVGPSGAGLDTSALELNSTGHWPSRTIYLKCLDLSISLLVKRFLRS